MEPGNPAAGWLAGAVKIKDEKVQDTKFNVTADCGVIKAGKKFIRITE